MPVRLRRFLSRVALEMRFDIDVQCVMTSVERLFIADEHGLEFLDFTCKRMVPLIECCSRTGMAGGIYDTLFFESGRSTGVLISEVV